MRARGGKLVTDAELLGLERNGSGSGNVGNVGWIARTAAGDAAAPVVVNAAGAWCEVVGAMAGAAPIGLVPKRRTAFIFMASCGQRGKQASRCCSMGRVATKFCAAIVNSTFSTFGIC